jgi:hypothetical protein
MNTMNVNMTTMTMAEVQAHLQQQCSALPNTSSSTEREDDICGLHRQQLEFMMQSIKLEDEGKGILWNLFKV